MRTVSLTLRSPLYGRRLDLTVGVDLLSHTDLDRYLADNWAVDAVRCASDDRADDLAQRCDLFSAFGVDLAALHALETLPKTTITAMYTHALWYGERNFWALMDDVNARDPDFDDMA